MVREKPEKPMFKGLRIGRIYAETIGLGVTIASIYIALVAHAAATTFKLGYLSYFGIDIQNTGYWPTATDLMGQPIVVVCSIALLIAIGYLSTLLVNGVHWLLRKVVKKCELKKLEALVDDKPYDNKLTAGVLLVLFIFISLKIPLYDSRDRGIEAASQQTDFTAIVSESREKRVLIYQYDGVGLFKTYDTVAQSFSNSYEMLDLVDKELQVIRLDRSRRGD